MKVETIENELSFNFDEEVNGRIKTLEDTGHEIIDVKFSVSESFTSFNYCAMIIYKTRELFR